MSQATFEFSSHTENLAKVRAFVRAFLDAEGVPLRASELLALGVDEACSNVIRHAYNQDFTQPISLSCERVEQTIRFRLRDFGNQADAAQFNRRPPEAVEPGGLGLYLIERIFDETVYTPQAVGTELILVKHLI